MSDYCRNFIDMFGNSAVKSLTDEVNRRLRANNSQSAVYEVLYGKSLTDQDEIEQLTGSSWISTARTSEFGDETQLLFTSESPADKFENHLVWFYSKIDSDVVLCNKYDSENGEYIGIRLKLVRNSRIITFQRYESISATVIYADDIDEDDHSDQITWEDLWDRQRALIKEAKKEMITAYPYTEKLIS
jgi:hypothetical protein